MSLKDKLQKFFQRSRAEQRLFFSAGGLLFAIRISLAILPFSCVRKVVSILVRDSKTQNDATWEEQTVDNVVWAVMTASRYSPIGMNCFPRALATHVLLRRRYINAELKIGVSRKNADLLEAHAWVVCDDRVIMGDLSDLERFKPLGQLDGKLM